MPNYLADIIQKVFDGTNSIRTTATGNVTLSDPKGFIGLVTVGGGSVGTSFTGNITLDAGSKTQIVGNMTLSDPKGYIGLVTVTQASAARSITGNLTLSDAKGYIGLTTMTEDGYSYNNYAGDGTITIKSGPGKLHGLSINSKSIGGPCVLYDSLLPSGNKIASVDTTLAQDTLLYDVNFTTGLTLDTSAVSTAADLTVSYR